MADLSEFRTQFEEAARALVGEAVAEIRQTIDTVVTDLARDVGSRVGEAFETNENEIREELKEDYQSEPTELHELLDEHDLKELSLAIRRGDRAEAEYRLDRLVDGDTRAKEWVEQARYSVRARAA